MKLEDLIIREVSNTSTDKEYVIETIIQNGKFIRNQVNEAIQVLIKDGMLQELVMNNDKVFLRVTRKED